MLPEWQIPAMPLLDIIAYCITRVLQQLCVPEIDLKFSALLPVLSQCAKLKFQTGHNAPVICFCCET